MDDKTLFTVLVIFFGVVAFRESFRRWRTVAKARNNDSIAYCEIQPYGWNLYQTQFWYGLRGMLAASAIIVTAVMAWYYTHFL